MSRRDDILAKLWERSHEEPAPAWLHPSLGPCRIWDGPTSGNGRGGGYGRMSLDGATVATHITSWVNENGVLPPRKQLDHLCRRRLCWNDQHLEPVTHKQNQKRRALWAASPADSSTALQPPIKQQQPRPVKTTAPTARKAYGILHCERVE